MEHRCQKKKSEKRSQKTRKQKDVIIDVRQNKNENKAWEESGLPGAEGVGGKGSRLVKREAWASSGAAHGLSAPRS